MCVRNVSFKYVFSNWFFESNNISYKYKHDVLVQYTLKNRKLNVVNYIMLGIIYICLQGHLINSQCAIIYILRSK